MSTTYYVATAGSNSNNGTSTGTPFLTLAQAVSVAIAGDSILLNGGDTFTENVTISVILASLSSYGTGNATVVLSSSSSPAIGCTVPPLSVTNLNLQGSTSVYTGNSPGPVIFRVLTGGATVYAGCTISGCAFSTGSQAAIQFIHNTADNGGVTGIRINNNTFNNIGGVGILIESDGVGATYKNYSDIIINSNTISNILGNTGTTGNADGWGIVMNGCVATTGAVLIHDNVIHDLGINCNATLTGGGTAWQCENCDSVQCFNNVAYNLNNTNTSGDGGEGFDIDYGNTNCVCYDNYVCNADGAALACYSSGGTYTGNVFRNNIGLNVARNTSTSGIFISGDAPYLFVNNTIVTAGSQPALTFYPGNAYTSKVLNNILVSSAGVSSFLVPAGGTTVSGMTVDGNYHQSGDGLFLCTGGTGTTYTTLSAWQTATGWETSGVAAGHLHFAAPQPPPTTRSGAGAALAPVAGAPVFAAGANLLGTYGITPSADFNGAAWTQNSIGAIYTPGIPTTFAAALYPLNPLLWYRLAEPSGTAGYDSIGTFQPLVYSAVTLGGSTLAAGDGSPTSAAFNGTSSMAAGVAASHTYGLTALSVVITFNPTVVNVSSQLFFESINTTTNAAYVLARLSNSSLIFAVADSGTGHVQATFTTSLVAGMTYTAVLTWTGTTLGCYLDGGSALPPSYGAQIALASGLNLATPYLGASYNGGSPSAFANAAMSEVTLVPAVLTQSQSAALYAAITTAPSTGGQIANNGQGLPSIMWFQNI